MFIKDKKSKKAITAKYKATIHHIGCSPINYEILDYKFSVIQTEITLLTGKKIRFSNKISITIEEL